MLLPSPCQCFAATCKTTNKALAHASNTYAACFPCAFVLHPIPALLATCMAMQGVEVAICLLPDCTSTGLCRVQRTACTAIYKRYPDAFDADVHGKQLALQSQILTIAARCRTISEKHARATTTKRRRGRERACTYACSNGCHEV